MPGMGAGQLQLEAQGPGRGKEQRRCVPCDSEAAK